ncbi:hypothetical protein JHK82_034940 [Glycine max]|nr:hypothetical protein JHK85_035652 [Glycine max]KAG5111671.1 hypothetical protein JHK82_034940 [Glycine max]
MEQLKREEARKHDTELCLDRFRIAQGLALLVFEKNLNYNDVSFIESLLQSVGYTPLLWKLEDFLGDSSVVMCYSDHHHHHHLGVHFKKKGSFEQERCISRRKVHLNKKAMSQKENLISELHPRKGTWKIAMRITNMWDVKKHNGRQVIDMVLIDQTGVKIEATLWQELFPEFQPKLALGCSYLIQNIKVVDNQSEYKVSPIPYLLYFVKTTSVKEVERLEIPANVHKKGDKFSHNAQMVSLGDISRLREGGDEIKVFPECVDDLVGKTLALRDEQTIGKSPASCAETSSGDYHPTPSLSQSTDYDHGNTAFITPAKRLSGQQTTNEFDSEDTTAYDLSTNKHIKAE